MRYRILGVTQAEDDHGTLIPVGGPRLRALLTALALHPGRPVTPDALIDEVWADAPPQDAPAALQALVGRLRRTLGKDTVTSTPGGYRLAATEADVDLYVFERLVRQGTAALDRGDPSTASHDLTAALTLWRGPALADLPDRTAAATRPESLRLEATRARIEADLRLGRAQNAVPELRELTTAHPYDEPLHALLIRALRDTGRPADALAAYETTRHALAEGLGTDPGPELRALHAELLAPTASIAPTAPVEPAALTAPTEPAPPEPSKTSAAQPHPHHTPPGRQDPHHPHRPHHPTQPPERNGNLRPRLTSFVGRELELDAIRSELHRARLVTLTGPGGSGKTRLAEEAATGLPQAWLVELAPLDRPEAVPAAVVNALGLRETVLPTNEMSAPQDDPIALLIEYCAPRSQLLILDNCEHVIGAAATLAETLLTRCPGLTILATSREPLGVPGELVRPVEPLLPDQAHRLFAERAAAVRPDAEGVLSDERDEGAVGAVGAVTEICRRLDGLPLAIELAAARLRLLTPRQIADRLDDRFRLLTSGSRTVLPRQQTLRAVVDWSWDLLDPPERTVLREASVFAGGWDLEAAEAVCTGPVADVLGALVDKSLIVATPCERDGSDGMRYRMLETIHEYAVERAAELPELRLAAERRHRAWVRTLVEEADPRLRSADQLPWISRLETELDNIRAALDRALTTGDEPDATSIALAMGWFWWLRNYRVEGVAWATRILHLCAALDATTPTPTSPSAASPTPTSRPTTSPSATSRPTTGPAASAIAASATHAAGEVSRPAVQPPAHASAPPAVAVDPLEAFLAAPEGEAHHPRHAPRMSLRVLHLFLAIEFDTVDHWQDERQRRYVERVRAHFAQGGPEAARVPGLVWPLTHFILGDTANAGAVMDAVLANCRVHGGDWEIGCILMFRTHMLVDSPGGLVSIDDDLAELRILSRRAGDRWMRAQVCSAAGETAMSRSRFDEAKGEFEEGLRLAHEVGAYAETPFLVARLAEIAYRSGDHTAALAALEEASVAADRYGVADSRAFVLLMRAQIALDGQDTARARELCEAARVETDRATPPPQFLVMLNAVDALTVTAESGPKHGLPRLVDTLHLAVEKRCADVITANLTAAAAELLTRLGDHPRAVRLLAASEHWRGGHPRSQPERAHADRAEAAARTALGAEQFAAEHTRGTALTYDDVLRALDEAVRDLHIPTGRMP